MPDLLVLPSGRILMVVGAEGLSDGSEIWRKTDRFSFCTLFYSDDHGQTWHRDLPLGQVQPGSSVVPSDSPGLCQLDDGQILVVCQAADRSKAGDSLFGYHLGMSVMGTIIEPHP
ncbi:MAG: glycoside hydrolase [Pirellulales bacterium]|nr:glycoside hydrolase [Pirellulales bacterium]